MLGIQSSNDRLLPVPHEIIYKIGTRHGIHSRTRYRSKRFKLKDYILPSGRVIKVQGYETYALDMLFRDHVEDDIVVGTKNIENFSGKLFYLEDDKKHRYFPDIYVKSENKIYEVKSTWTLRTKWFQNELKRFAVLDAGLNFEYFVVRQFDIRECKATRSSP